MGEVVNVVVAFAVIVFIIRWAIRGGGENEEAVRIRNLLGFRPKNATDDMIMTVQGMFPDIPRDNIRYDLLRTGSVEITSNKLLERGFLEQPPPGYFELYPAQPIVPRARADNIAVASTAGKESLISRLHLEDRVNSETSTSVIDPGGKATWEDNPARREASLRERKAQMVLAARKRLLEQEKNKVAGSSLS